VPERTEEVAPKDGRPHTRQSPQLLRQVLEAHRGECHAIVLHNYPDPDAIASALAHKRISAAYGIETDILYGGTISHPQNLALVKLLEIDLKRYDDTLDLGRYAGAVLVDNQGTSCAEVMAGLTKAGIPFVAVVDHHALQDNLKAEFTDIRRVGATSTLYADYLQHGLLTLDRARQDDVAVATALLHGLFTDTGGFIRAGAEDFQAASFLSQFRDSDVLGQIMSQARSKQTMELIHRALGQRMIVESYSIAGVGYVRAEDRDAIPQAADFLLTEENVHTAIVYGIVTGDEREEALVGSMRTAKLTVDPDSFIKEVLGKNAEGRYSGGGKLTAGGFEMPLGFLSGGPDGEFRDLKWRTHDAQIKQKLLNKIGVEQKPAAG
jgi:nanoRNase/pAp phosphatase (c-di-AMP/oligoRNAs hydrolase)